MSEITGRTIALQVAEHIVNAPATETDEQYIDNLIAAACEACGRADLEEGALEWWVHATVYRVTEGMTPREEAKLVLEYRE